MSLCLVPGLDLFCLVEVIRPSSVVDTGEFSTVVTNLIIFHVLKMDVIGYNSINMLMKIMHRKKKSLRCTHVQWKDVYNIHVYIFGLFPLQWL